MIPFTPPKQIKNFNLFISGKLGGFAGKVVEFEPPKLKIKTEEYLSSVQDTPILLENGLEPLTASFTLAEVVDDIITLFGQGVIEGALKNGTVIPEFVVKGLMESAIPERLDLVMRGYVTELDLGTWKAGERANFKFSIAVYQYIIRKNGQDIVDIDVLTGKRKIEGVTGLLDLALLFT